MNVKQLELKENEVPERSSDDSLTKCCPRFQPEGWGDCDMHFRNKLFVKVKTRSLMHIPINMGRVFSKTMSAIRLAEAEDQKQLIVLSRELSPWSAEHFFAVTGDVPGQEMVQLSGDYHTCVFEGPYKNVAKWHDELLKQIDDHVHEPEIFFFYTTCPKCAKQYGKNYVVGIVTRETSV